MSCCDFDNDIYDNKIKKLENNLKNFEKEQNKTNAEIYTLLKQSGVDFSQYYALNEDDYTRTLTSDDDVNTLEPGAYKIVKTDMPQNAPTGSKSPEYDGTLIQSNSYALLFENGFDVYHHSKTSDETWTEWERIATQEWVNQQIQDITGGSVTEDWVKSNYYALTLNQYKPIPENADYATLNAGCYYGNASNFTNEIISSLVGNILLIKFVLMSLCFT